MLLRSGKAGFADLVEQADDPPLSPIGIPLPFQLITFGSKANDDIRLVSIRHWIQLET